MKNLTPMMQQYLNIKEKYKDTILFFRLGDFYEMFFDDAILASKELEITLTGRDCGNKERAPMCGVPFHSADAYIAKLVKKGYKVAICEQIEDPSKAKGIVKRDVVRIITPGTITDTKVLEDKNNNYLCSIYMDTNGIGISYVDVTTGELYTTEIKCNEKRLINILFDELAKIRPTEIILNDYLYNKKDIVKIIENKFNSIVNLYCDWSYEYNDAKEAILNQMSVLSLDGYGLNEKVYSVLSLGTLINYLNETQKISLNHLNNVTFYTIDNFMMLDINTRINLELTETIRGKSKKGSLFGLLDCTSTSMGGRMLKRWIEEPLINIEDIKRRLDAVDYLFNNFMVVDEIKELFKNVYDIERIIGKIVYGTCNARDLISLKKSISVLPTIKKILCKTSSELLLSLGRELDTLKDIYELIDNAIIDEPPISIKEGNIIKDKYSKELFELREAATKGKEWIYKLEQNEKERTGIKSLKVGYNKVFGYYIEVTKSNLKYVPDEYIRKQTLANAERYITPELKEMEAKILGAEDKIVKLEYDIFLNIRDTIKNQIKMIQKSAKIVAVLDVFCAFAITAYKNNYVKPKLNLDGIIQIKNGRHPVVEKTIGENLFIPNDTYLDNGKNRIAIITGPNMAGKSTYMRQVALITLMAHIGSFVPADDANIGIVDRIFTRVGASDNLSQGQSTFMVEMSEVANILNNGTKNSLIILDEIGRGTSTFDGLSIAWAVIEYISDKIKAKTLFATHYHELSELEGKIEGINNFRILVKEKGDDIIFLRKIDKGSADKSYGIQVAKLAGVPIEVIKRAKEILHKLEETDINNTALTIDKNINKNINVDDANETNENQNEYQLDIFNLKYNNLIDRIKSIDIMKVTPLDAINILYEIVKEANKL
ncbi:DNA mismatch repair protein MutS [Caloranaerobacter azorensis DSM 13643]|uniref:DNA mismatch repair protein MutS n=1 Tax=Caloranaerobacter azorensis DSM 13643 TaxID=1121264 RepID=A0A1M5VSZ1_9FIRM|nr:DNA mismatch repair protein MutS [Caloranaerobacter azorensis]SHH78361.1 DNA mismatch repair protein MutS [Caloranaerobacter azorensis DSM 13643]